MADNDEKNAEAEWRQRFAARMVERGVDPHDAKACSEAGEIDLSIDPANAADDELSYWSDE